MENKEKLMATIFFDTCAINALVKQGLEGHEIKKKLAGHVPVIGRNTLYECAKNHKHRIFCKKIFIFIEELDPWYTLTREHLYEIEILKLTQGGSISCWCSKAEKDHISLSNKPFILGSNEIYQNELARSITRREQNIKDLQNRTWFPEPNSKLKHNEKKAYNISFAERVCQIQEDPPGTDRFFDAIQFTEASYCTTFVSEEAKLVNDKEKSKNEKELYGRKLNPDIELLHIENFMAHLNTKTT